MFEFGFFAKYTNINKFFLRQVWAICINHSISFIVIGYEYPHQLWGWNIWNIEVMHSYSLEKQKPFATSVFGSPSQFFFFFLRNPLSILSWNIWFANHIRNLQEIYDERVQKLGLYLWVKKIALPFPCEQEHSPGSMLKGHLNLITKYMP